MAVQLTVTTNTQTVNLTVQKYNGLDDAYSKNETDVYRTLMDADILNSNQIITMVDGLPSEIIHKRAGVTIRTDTYTFSGNQVIESRELPTGEKVTLTTDTLTLTTNIVYYGI